MTQSSAPGPPENSHQIRVLIGERDHMASQLLAESLERDSHYQVVALPAVSEVLSAATLRKPDVAVISADFPVGSRKGLQVARMLNMRLPNIRIVILLDVLERESVVPSFRSGATGVFCRTGPVSEFRACIEQVSRGEVWARDSAAEYLLEALRSSPSCDAMQGNISMLSKREIEVVEHAVQGHTNRQIASQLRLSEHTVKNYLFRVYEKLGVSNRMELLFLSSTHHKNSFREPLSTEGWTNSLQGYLRAAREGWLSAQFILGLAYWEGRNVEKNEQSAYYWLRMAEENSAELRRRLGRLIQEVRATLAGSEIETLEKSLMAQKENMLVGERIADFMKAEASSENPIRSRRVYKTA